MHRQIEWRKNRFGSKQRKCSWFPQQPSFTKSNSNALEIFHVQHMNLYPHIITTAIIYKNMECLHVIAIPLWFCNAIYTKYGEKM